MLGARGEGGETYARKLDIARSSVFGGAREAVLKAVEKSNSDRRPKTPPEEVVEVLSPEEALAKAERRRRSARKGARNHIIGG